MADENELINQDDIEALLQGGGSADPAPAPEADSGSADSVDQSEIEQLLGGGASDAASSSPSPAAAPAVDDADKLLGQNDIEKLLNQSGAAGGASTTGGSAPLAPESQPAGAARPAPDPGTGNSAVSQDDVEFLLNQAEKALESVTNEPKPMPQAAAEFEFREFTGAPANAETATLDLLSDVGLDLKIELGRTNMYLEEVLKLRKGAVVPLDKLAGDPVDIFVNGRLIARGEVLVLNDNFCVRVAELVASTSPVA